MRKGFAVVLIFAVFVISGCAEPCGWRFTPNTYTQPPKPLFLKSVVVPPFKDSRPNENSDKIALFLIPIMPFGWANLSAPESWSPFFKYRPTEDFARAAAEELRATGLFKEAFFAERTSEGDLILRGEIKSTHYNQKIISYGLSIYAGILYLIGLPSGTVSNDLVVKLSLEDQVSKAALWKKEYTKEYSGTSWLYSGAPLFQYDVLYTEILKNAIEDMRSDLQKNGLAQAQ